MKISAFCILAMLAAMATPGSAGAQTREVPGLLSFQSLLFDDGGNPIADGPVAVTFRIKDASGQTLYEESQSLDAIRGQLSALVGGGLTAAGAPTGGIPASALDPSGSRYLEAEVAGFPATSPMEIASVPYALYAGEALSASSGSIGSEAVADGSIAYEDLSGDLVRQLAGEITGGRDSGNIVFRDELNSIYRDPSAASTIGVRPGFVYSASNDLQGALTDLDRAIKRRDERIDAESKARGDRDAAHASTDISAAHPNGAFSIARLDADIATQAELDAEVQARQVQADAINAQAAADVAEAQESAANEVQNLRQVFQQQINSKLHPSAWGSITWSGDSSALAAGANVQNCNPNGPPAACVVTFVAPRNDTNYAVVLSPAGNCSAYVAQRGAAAFQVAFPGIKCPFDFIVIGQ